MNLTAWDLWRVFLFKRTFFLTNKRAKKDQRVLVTTLTKRMAEDLAEYLSKKDVIFGNPENILFGFWHTFRPDTGAAKIQKNIPHFRFHTDVHICLKMLTPATILLARIF